MLEGRSDQGKFSCAVDCFIELSEGIFVSYLQICKDRSDFCKTLNQCLNSV